MARGLEFDIDVDIMHVADDPMVLWNRFGALSSNGTTGNAGATISSTPTPATGLRRPASTQTKVSPKPESSPIRLSTPHVAEFMPALPISPLSIESPPLVPVHLGTDGGPDPALLPSERKLHQYVQTVAGTVSVGHCGAVLGNIDFRGVDGVDQCFWMNFDLGSSSTWVLGSELKGKHFGVPGDYGAHFWFPVDRKSKTEYRQTYADTSYAVFTLWKSWMKLALSPSAPIAAAPQVVEDIPLQLGLAHEVVGDSLTSSLASGVLGLGPSTVVSIGQRKSPAFLYQIRDCLASPEMTMQLGPNNGRFVFGRRKEVIAASIFGPWTGECAHDAAYCDAYWALESHVRLVSLRGFSNPSQHVVLDSGCASIYIDDDAAEYFYSLIPGAIKVGKSHYLPKSLPPALKSPGVSFKMLNGTFMEFKTVLDDPTSDQFSFDNTPYYLGAIQSKKSIGTDGFVGPDIIGRAGLVHLEVNFKFPSGRPATISWRSKRSHHVGPTAADWGVPIFQGAS